MPSLLSVHAPESAAVDSEHEVFPVSDAADYLLAETNRVEVGPIDDKSMAELRTDDPQTADKLEEALAELPNTGDLFLGFRLIQELGRGAFGRVFLAQQVDLAHRLVALKIAVNLNGESQRLAQLQHTNIVPIYSEHRSNNLHAVCMPYCGSTTLADICKSLRSSHSLPTSGKQLLSTLFNRQTTLRSGHEISLPDVSLPSDASGTTNLLHASHSPAPSLATSPATLTKIEQMSYVDAVLWMTSRLAEGLAHAHERGIIHRDLKPANILLCDDGQPMLLDFNLAEDMKLRSAMAVAQVGGTLPYMAPEQLMAFRDGDGKIDGRGDIYALGLIVYHLLTGRHAFPIRKGPSRVVLPQMIEDRTGPLPALRPFNRAVTPAVEAIVQRCLEPDPAKRYASARDLAEDIDRHRADLPLLHTPEPSLGERAAKWARRHPKLFTPTALSCMIAAIMLAGTAVYISWRGAEARREQAAFHLQSLTTYHENFLPESRLCRDKMTSEDPSEVSEGLKHAETALSVYGPERDNWMDQPKVKVLEASEQARLKAEVGEIAFLMAQSLYLQPNQPDNEKALRLNEVAQKNLDEVSKPAAQQQRVVMTNKKLDEADREKARRMLENAAGQNPRARFLLACDYAAQGRYREALTQVDAAVSVNPSDFGSWFLKARCHQALNQNTEAVAAYGTAIALRPNYPYSYVARATIHYAERRNLAQALEDLNQALILKPNLLDARINHGLVLHAMNKHAESLKDFDDELMNREDAPTRVWFIRSRIRRAAGDEKGADEDLQRGLGTQPADPVSFVARGMAKLPKDADGALADLQSAEQMFPRGADATYNQAHVLVAYLKKNEEAIAALDRLLEHNPDHHRGRGYRAILLARTGKMDDAVAEARKLMKMTTDPENTYRAACALAIASEKQPALKSESLKLLASALARGFGRDKLETDHDLDAIRNMPEFKNYSTFCKYLAFMMAPARK